MLIKKMKIAQKAPHYLVANADHGSESNYRYLEEELPRHTKVRLDHYSNQHDEIEKKQCLIYPK
ncbi:MULTISPECIES: hypothetical protein [Enterococcus]|uniref:hypothetical protein n=1 Tax=Enterococcus TaxID=1350 RepID=UPI0032196967